MGKVKKFWLPVGITIIVIILIGVFYTSTENLFLFSNPGIFQYAGEEPLAEVKIDGSYQCVNWKDHPGHEDSQDIVFSDTQKITLGSDTFNFVVIDVKPALPVSESHPCNKFVDHTTEVYKNGKLIDTIDVVDVSTCVETGRFNINDAKEGYVKSQEKTYISDFGTIDATFNIANSARDGTKRDGSYNCGRYTYVVHKYIITEIDETEVKLEPAPEVKIDPENPIIGNIKNGRISLAQDFPKHSDVIL